MPRVRMGGGRRRIEPVDIGEQHQAVGLDHGGDAGAQPVVVAVADLRRGDGIVLVDDGHRAHLQQGGDRGARVEIVAALLGDVGRDENLPGHHAIVRQRRFPGAAQCDLADAGGGLALLQRQRRPVELQDTPPQRDGARGDDDDLGAAPAQRVDIGGDRLQPFVPWPPGGAIDDQSRADLDGDAAEGTQRIVRCARPFGERIHQGIQCGWVSRRTASSRAALSASSAATTP